MSDARAHVSASQGYTPVTLVFPTVDDPAVSELQASLPLFPNAAIENLFCVLLFQARAVALSRVKISHGVSSKRCMEYCEECRLAAYVGELIHDEKCCAGAVLGTLAGIMAQRPAWAKARAGADLKRRKEDAPGGEEARAEDGESSLGSFGEPWQMVGPVHLKTPLADQDGTLVGASFGRDEQDQARDAVRIAACVKFCEGIPAEVLQRELPLASAERRRWNELMHLRRALPFLAALPARAQDAEVGR